MTVRRPTCTLTLCLATAAFIAVQPSPASAQATEIGAAIGGTAGGAVAGVYATAAIYVAKARFGSFIYSMDDILRVRLETIPLLTLPIAGGVLGALSPSGLRDAAIYGAVGFVGGAALGAGLGRWAWGKGEGTWAGGIVGSALGMVTGTVLGAATHGGDSESPPGASGLTISVPIAVSW